MVNGRKWACIIGGMFVLFVLWFWGSFPYGKNWLDAVLEKRKIFDQAANSAFQRKYLIGLSEHKNLEMVIVAILLVPKLIDFRY